MNSNSKTQSPDSLKSNRINLRYHVLGILVLSVVMFYLLDSATDDEVLGISSLLEMSEQGYDYFMADVDSMHYTPAGQIDYRFQARRMTHYPNPEYSLLDSPRFFIFKDDSSKWEVVSDSGRVEMDTETDQERLILIDNVIIEGITADGQPVNITTDTLILYPEAKIMSSESDVIFKAEGFISSSRGFTADLNTNVIRQLADGQMQYGN